MLVAGPLFFARLDAPLLEPQEPRYAEIPRQMLAEGRLLVPVLHGQPYLDKPPLLYWLVMGSYTLFGVHDWAARLVPGGAGVLTVLLTYLWGRRAAGERAGLCAALVLGLSPEFLYRQRMLLMDGLLCLWVTAGLAAAHVALLAPRLRRGWWLLSALACGLGLLTKGPVALVLVAGPLLAYTALEPRCGRVSVLAWLAYLATAAGVALPWYAAVAWAGPAFFRDFFWTHNVVRFLRPFDHQEPAWFYLPALLLGTLPWSLLWPGLIGLLVRRSPATAARRPPALGFFLPASLAAVGFFSASGCKRAAYLLPALPPLALALGCYLDARLPRPARWHAWEALWRCASRLAFGATLLSLLLGLGVVAAASGKQLVPATTGLALGSAGLVGLVMASAVGRRVSWAGCMAATFAVLLLGVQVLLPVYSRQYALREDLRAYAGNDRGAPLRVACYPQRWDSVSFYLPDAEVVAYPADQRGRLLADLRSRPETLLVAKSGRALQELLGDLPPSAEFVGRERQGAVTVGRVRPRRHPAAGQVAGR